MRAKPLRLAALMLCGAVLVPPVRAWAQFAQTPTAAQAAQTPIVGQEVMGDKSRSGPDGWVQAPVSRNQAPDGTAPGQTAASIAASPDARPSQGEGKTLPPGRDPGTPAVTSPSGPGTLDAPSAAAKP